MVYLELVLKEEELVEAPFVVAMVSLPVAMVLLLEAMVLLLEVMVLELLDLSLPIPLVVVPELNLYLDLDLGFFLDMKAEVSVVELRGKLVPYSDCVNQHHLPSFLQPLLPFLPLPQSHFLPLAWLDQ